MLTLIKRSEASKLGGIATTYRSGHFNRFATCPMSCPLLPLHSPASSKIDKPYLDALLKAVPKRGIAWTYTHFPAKEIPITTTGVIINVSTDTIENAVNSFSSGYPTVYAAPYQWIRNVPKYPTEQPIKFVECPANLNKNITCRNCGNGRPLCARPDRDYIIVFPGHGVKKKSVGTPNSSACYGAYGPTGWQWYNAARKSGQDRPDEELLTDWVKTLPYGSYLRHHIVGDLGCISSTGF